MMDTDKLKQRFNDSRLRYGLVLIAGFLLGWLIFSGEPHGAPAESPTEHSHENATRLWTCSMHPQIKVDKPGKCPICGMDLVALQTGDTAAAADPDAIQPSKEAIALANIQTTIAGRQRPV
ncbi:MAG: efflux RND transporter periplasmic adaptor subunit, partial [Tannerellaceae bacterium]|nr:efflux RND transporter periplasmic adaptor subunit [Tannerellaceae bacterium]